MGGKFIRTFCCAPWLRPLFIPCMLMLEELPMFCMFPIPPMFMFMLMFKPAMFILAGPAAGLIDPDCCWCCCWRSCAGVNVSEWPCGCICCEDEPDMSCEGEADMSWVGDMDWAGFWIAVLLEGWEAYICGVILDIWG